MDFFKTGLLLGLSGKLTESLVDLVAKGSSEGLCVKGIPEQVHKDLWDSGDDSATCLLWKHEEPSLVANIHGKGQVKRHQGGRDGQISGVYQPANLAQLASLGSQ